MSTIRIALIILYCVVGLTSAGTLWPIRCHPEKFVWWWDPGVYLVGAALWPMTAAVRLGIVIVDPVAGARPFGCPPAQRG
jgi:hypothetical protein